MSGTHTSLDAAATDRKARLAKLASLKRKQPGSDTTVSDSKESTNGTSSTDVYLSRRNYDPETKGPRLGFENNPSTNITTLEQQADIISTSVAAQALQDEAEAEKGIDLFKLRPKKPNWDLKRDLAERMKVADVRTQNAIARLVRQRIEESKKAAMAKNQSGTEQGEEVGIDGMSLVEGVHLREREEEEEERRTREEEQEVDAAS